MDRTIKAIVCDCGCHELLFQYCEDNADDMNIAELKISIQPCLNPLRYRIRDCWNLLLGRPTFHGSNHVILSQQSQLWGAETALRECADTLRGRKVPTTKLWG